MNLGAEYRIRLPFDLIKDLALRAGYIYDPQPYQFSESYARNYFSVGISLSVGQLDANAAAKISLSPKELQRFHSNLFQLGLSYGF